METLEFMKRLLQHTVLAAGLFFLAAVVLERLLPGFVGPFVNLPEFALPLMLGAALTVWFPPDSRTRIGSLFAWVALIAASVVALLFVYTRAADRPMLWLLVPGLAAVIVGIMLAKGKK